jgi:hypothetical protein
VSHSTSVTIGAISRLTKAGLGGRRLVGADALKADDHRVGIIQGHRPRGGASTADMDLANTAGRTAKLAQVGG